MHKSEKKLMLICTDTAGPDFQRKAAPKNDCPVRSKTKIFRRWREPEKRGRDSDGRGFFPHPMLGQRVVTTL
jgi:hypothetical protein